MATAKEIGKRFKEERKRRGLSADEVCRASRIHPNIIADIEGGVFDRIGAPYIKSFLKKYALFLELDSENILKEYEAVILRTPAKKFSLNIETQDEKNPSLNLPKISNLRLPQISKKDLRIIGISAISVISIVLMFMIVNGIRSALSRRPVKQQVKTAAVQTKRKKAPLKKKKETDSPLVLTLKARGEVWIKVKKGRKTLFEGVLERGGSRTWRTNGTINVWTGKGEVLDFVINTRRAGAVINGVVKNISVSSSGIKVGDKWVFRLEN